MSRSKPEILAPVGSYEMLLAAVRAGADAVYLGGENFNARRRAENFSESALKNAVSLCKISGVKVYLTLNTCVGDTEIEEAVQAAYSACKAGIDAVIVADLGLAAAINNALPELPLHASTQMSVLSESALELLAKMGFSRVVVGREMSRDTIREFVKKANELGIETEVFVHGALCMSVSGQCLLSSVIGGRSGNRGLCAGPCRLPFSGSSEYSLSLKDLSLLEYANELAEMGVASLKIEGRMKRPEYVAAAVSAFAAALNNEDYSKSAKRLQNVFSRSGFTSGYYTKNTGADMFGIRTAEDVAASADVLSEIHSLYRNEKQRVGVTISVNISENRPASLEMSDFQHTATVFGAVPEAAKNKALEKQAVAASLEKLGSTPYFAKKTDITLGENLFLSAAELNALRRNAVEALNEKRAQVKSVQYTPKSYDIPDKKRGAASLYCRFESAEQIPEGLTGIDLICLPVGADFEKAKSKTNAALAIELPRAAENEALIASAISKAQKSGVGVALCGTLAGLQLALSAGLQVIADTGFNVYNSLSANTLSQLGASSVIASAELTVKQVNTLKTPMNKGVFAYGRLPIMVTKNCPVRKNGCENCGRDRQLTDRTGVKFPVRCQSGFSVVYNSKPHYLADRKNEFSVDFLYLYFTDETALEAEKIIKAHKNGEKPSGEFTRGLYYREVY